MDWNKRGAKLVSVFFTGYGGGFAVSVPTHYLITSHEIDWIMVFTFPLISGLLMTFPQIGKMFGDFANES
jgi:hypothetical protein